MFLLYLYILGEGVAGAEEEEREKEVLMPLSMLKPRISNPSDTLTTTVVEATHIPSW